MECCRRSCQQAQKLCQSDVIDAEEFAEGGGEAGAVADSSLGPFTNRACPIKPTETRAAAGTATVNDNPVASKRPLIPNNTRGMSPRMTS